ncbi:MAG: MmgE/PrpD family protein [Alphaproteobacteria bacterium]|nr:MmgE/PrpD family protein [Alphaproteobacteria bacterium]
MNSTSPRQDSVTTMLAREMAETPSTAVPRSAINAIERLAIDHTGIAYMGAAFTGKGLHAYALDLGGRPDAILIGHGARVPAELAAGLNAQFCHVTDFHETGPGLHVGPLCWHVAFAIGQRVHASGRDVLAAAALGYVLCGRFHFARTADSSVPQQCIVAAAIASRLLGHDTATTARSISLAAELPYRPLVYFLAAKVPKRITPFGSTGFCTRAGVQAALWAEHGVESVPDEVDQWMAGYDRAILLQQPTPYHWVDGQMELKPWVCSRHSQAGIQSVVDLVREHAIDPRSVTAVKLRLSGMYVIPHQFEPSPDTYMQATLSTQWAVAMVLQRIPPGPRWVNAERLADPFSRELARRVAIEEDPAWTRAYKELRWFEIGGAAEIVAGGKTFRRGYTIAETYGSPGVDMTDAMVEEKFLECTSLSMSAERARKLLAGTRRIAEFADINELVALM